MSFAVLLNEMRDIPMHEVAPIIAQASETMILADVTRALRDPTGFLAKGLPHNEADTISRLLNDRGIGCFIMDENTMYHPPDHQILNTAVLREDSMIISDYYGRQTNIDWSNLVFIGVGKIMPHKKEQYTLGSTSDYDIRPSGGMAILPPGIGGGGIGYVPNEELRRKKPGKTKARHVLDMFLRAPQEAHFRAFSNAFNYGYLGRRIGMGSSQNFKLLVEDIVRFAPHVFGNKGTSALLGNGPRKDMEYPDERIFDEENLWMLQIVYLNLNQQ